MLVNNEKQYCEWCKKDALDVKEHRDYEEGLNGPVYDVCKDCRKKEAALLDEELNDPCNFYDEDFDEFLD